MLPILPKYTSGVNFGEKNDFLKKAVFDTDKQLCPTKSP
jgi:hypothetical protein